MTAAFTWCVTAVCLLGTVLNVKKRRECFYLWTLGNIAWMWYDLRCGLYSRAALDLVQLTLAVWGAWEWRRSAKNL